MQIVTLSSFRVLGSNDIPYIWPKKWNSFPKTNNLNDASIKHLRIHYSISLIPPGRDEYNPINKKIPYRFLRQFRKVPTKNLMIDIDTVRYPQGISKCIKFLKLGQLDRDPTLVLPTKKLLLSSKVLKTLHLSQQTVSSYFILKNIPKLRSLTTLHLTGLPMISDKQLKHTFIRQHVNIENITIEWPRNYRFRDHISGLYRILDIFSNLPKLKRFRFSGDTDITFNVSNIAFKIFKDRNIAYDIRVRHDNHGLICSPNHTTAPQNLDFLAINFRDDEADLIKWNLIQDEHLKLQHNAKNLLFLKCENRTLLTEDLLLQARVTVSTLDLLIQGDFLALVDFSPLQHFQRVKNVFIRIENTTSNPSNLLDNLTVCQTKYKTVQLLSLSIVNIGISHDHKPLLPLLQACSPTLTKLMLNLHKIPSFEIGTESFYQEVSNLLRLESLSVMVKHKGHASGSDVLNEDHIPHIVKIIKTKDSLEELNLIFPVKTLSRTDLVFEGSPKLKRLSVGLTKENYSSTDYTFIFSVFRFSPLLEHIELNVLELTMLNLNMLIVEVARLERLESLKLEYRLTGFDESIIKGNLEKMLRSHQSLRLIALKKDEVIVVRKGKYPVDLNNFGLKKARLNSQELPIRVYTYN